ncbi:VanZ family protein [Candidatus Gracilibacteria bacterium]|nr:VanZ family protein [Candidatus Gracilibacteria bacterium]MBS9784166.1 VanZ family protein [Candidatus Gracilibacteria bacterium]
MTRIFLYSLFYVYMIFFIDIAFLNEVFHGEFIDDSIQFKHIVHFQIIPFETIKDYLYGSMEKMLEQMQTKEVVPPHLIESYWEENTRNAIRVIGGNIALFIPFGFLLPFLTQGKITLKNSILWAIGLAFCKEFLQAILVIEFYFLLQYKVYFAFDIDDIILGSLGFLLGFFLYKIYIKILPTLKKLQR